MNTLFSMDELTLIKKQLSCTHACLTQDLTEKNGMAAVVFYEQIKVCESAQAHVNELLTTNTLEKVRNLA
jgi:hypothetical protein